MNKLRNRTKRISAYLAILCFLFLNAITLKAQAWWIDDIRIFTRNIVLIVFAAIVVLIIGIVLVRKEARDVVGGFLGLKKLI